ncbi:MAG: 3-hydroxyisobutyrate dehydrogenase [Salaquimonas sp.]|nr:3-hydroxyisobutyrate dehydrogenase [Salaquimonas sp.]
MTEIGFVGLGNMGLPMAANLVKSGYKVTGFDTVPAALDKAKAAGIAIAATSAEAASGRDIVITMLPNGKIVLSVFEEIVPACAPGTVIVDSSTIDVASARAAHDMAGKAGLLSVDAPVSGGVGGAEAGTLTFMIGGSEAALEKARPALEVMGGRLVHCGEGGAGQAAKMCNNMLLGISMIGACEAFALADKLGLSQKALFDVVSTSSGSCWSVNTYCPVPDVGPKSPADNDYRPGFAAALMLKDLNLSQQAAAEAGAATPMGRHATEIYNAFVEAGEGGTDFSGIIRFLDKARDM